MKKFCQLPITKSKLKNVIMHQNLSWLKFFKKALSVLIIVATTLHFQSSMADEQKIMEAICKKAQSVNFPQKDLPTKKEYATLKGCQSEKYYYGIGVPVNYQKARICAFIEKASSNEPVIGDSTILMMLYANGQGVRRNLDLATKLACNIWGAPAETVGRVMHLQSLKTQSSSNNFDICDDVTSGFWEGACARKDADIANAKHKVQIQEIIEKWSPQQQKAFQNLMAARNEFINARVSNEVDLTGTGRAAFEIEEKSSIENNFRVSLKRFEKGNLPFFSPNDYKKSDAKLNAIYKKIMNTKDNKNLQYTTITRQGIKKTEIAWLNYRDAWVKFGSIRYPQVTAHSWKTWLTDQRIEQLKDFLP